MPLRSVSTRLDLTYITPKIAVVSMQDDPDYFRAYLKMKHESRYKIINLAQGIELEHALEAVISFQMLDDLPGLLHIIEQLMMMIDEFLVLDGSNIVIFHCETGFNKCGFICTCLLMHLGIYTTVKEALDFFGQQRFEAAQDIYDKMSSDYIRYVYYYECLLRTSNLNSYTYQLDGVRFITVPNFETSVSRGGCYPRLNVDEVQSTDEKIFMKSLFKQSLSSVERFDIEQEMAEIDLSEAHVNVFGDVVLSFYSGNFFMFKICFNTAFVESNYLSFEKMILETPRQDFKCLTFSRDFKVELYLHKVQNKVSSV